MIIKAVMPGLLGVLTLALSGPSLGAFSATAEQARGIAKQAYLYGFPVVEMYKTLYTLSLIHI